MVRAIGLKNINVLQATNLVILGARQSVMTNFTSLPCRVSLERGRKRDPGNEVDSPANQNNC